MFVRRFETEAQLVARLEHPYIVPLYDFWRDPKGAYIVMRYLRGGSLSQRIKRDGPLTVDQTARMVNQISSALSVAHASGVVHRDLKPDNILLDEAGNYYLSDFGIAKDVGKDVNLTQTGTIIGSPAYLSPEQITGEPLTALSDVYTLGILLHFALTGEHPFPGKTPTAMLVHQMQDPMPPLNVHREDISDALEEVLQRATAKDPGSRFVSVNELALTFNQAMRSDEATPTDGRMSASVEESIVITGVDPANLPNPYKGLKAFEEADTGDFYGRDTLTQQLIERLQPQSDVAEGDHLLVIVGPSGSGKSSVVKAGLIPELRAGAVVGSETWFYADMVSGLHPMEEMEAALLRVAVNPPESLLNQLREDERGLLRAVKRVLPEDNTELVIFIDQFEEVFTLTEDEAERQHFLNSLFVAVTEPRSRLRLLITLRADFYDRPLSYHTFGELVRDYTHIVLPLSPQELESAIVEPAHRVGVSLEPGLGAAIIGDVRDQPGALPLLQYALTQLFEQRDGLWLTQDAYERIGGAMGALAKRAETIYENLSPTAQETARQLFLRLVTLGEGTEDTRRRVFRSELNALGNDAIMDQVIDTFGSQRLFTFDHDPQTREPTLEVAHEALIREWRRLREWLDNAREDLRTQRQLNSATREWLSANKDTSYLARGNRLGAFEALREMNSVSMNADENTYLTASLDARNAREAEESARVAREETLEVAARQRLQLLVVVASIAAVVASVLALIAFRSQQQAVDAQDIAEQAAVIAVAEEEEAQAVALAANALNLIDTYEPVLGLNLALEAAAQRPDVTAVQQALASAAYAPSAVAQLNPFEDASLLNIAFNPSGPQVAAGASNGRLLVFDTQTYETLLDIEAHTIVDGTIPVTAVAYSPDGNTIVSGDKTGTVRLWRAATGEMLAEIPAHDGSVNALIFDPDGGRLLSAGNDAAMVLWDTSTGERIREFDGHVGVVLSADWAEEAGWIVTSTGDDPADNTNIDRQVRIFDVETGELVKTISPEGSGWLRAVVINSDGSMVAVASFDQNQFGGTIRVYDTAFESLIRRISDHTDVITTLDLSPDERTLISGGWDRTMRQFDIASGMQILRFDTHNDRVLGARFSPDGRHAMVVAGRDSGSPVDGRAFYYTLESQALIKTVTGHDDWVWAVSYNSDGTLLATGSGRLSTAEGDNSVRIWDTETGQERAQLDAHTNTVNGVDFSPDGTQLASSSWDGQVILWDVTDLNNVTQLQMLTGHEGGVNDVDYSPEGDTVLSAGADGTLRLWNTETGELVRTIEAHDNQVIRAKFNSTGDLVASSSRDGTVRVWNVRTGEMTRDYTGHSGWVSTVNFSHDGQYLVSGADDNLIVWDLAAEDSEDAIFQILVGHQGFIYGGAFSPDDRYILSGASDTSVRLWEVATGEEIRQFNGHSNWVLDIEFHPEGHEAVTVAEDNTVRFWRVARTTDELIEWAQTNRYIPELTCAERDRYNVEPLCDILGDGSRGREGRNVTPTPAP
jgi:WD40 repeat protein/energy-coupling factor transporter ATP-binding protein EcfA2